MEDFIQHCPFSRFAEDVFSNASTHPVLYHLQHRAGFNINIVLYLLWLAKACYGRTTKRQVKLLQAQVALWHQRVIVELKITHALVANHPDPIALQIRSALQTEITKAHRIEQHMLYDVKLKTRLLRRSAQQQLLDACINIANYCELKNDVLLTEDESALQQIFQIVFDNASSDEITKQIQLNLQRFRLPLEQPIQTRWQEL